MWSCVAKRLGPFFQPNRLETYLSETDLMGPGRQKENEQQGGHEEREHKAIDGTLIASPPHNVASIALPHSPTLNSRY